MRLEGKCLAHHVEHQDGYVAGERAGYRVYLSERQPTGMLGKVAGVLWANVHDAFEVRASFAQSGLQPVVHCSLRS